MFTALKPGPAISPAQALRLLGVLLLAGGCTSADSSSARATHTVAAQLSAPAAETLETTPALALSAVTTVEQIIPALAGKRVVFVGEQHTRYDHHLMQLEIIRGLHRDNPRLAIGLEMFQQPFQRYLDDYVAGAISEQEMLRATEYYQRWRMDYRLYAPILRYARQHRLPLVALNLPVELTRQVGRVGLGGLAEDQRAQLPADIDRSDNAYEQRLRQVFDQHPNDSGQEFSHFLDVQLSWDEGMAERAATFLEENPDHQLVVLAGQAHVAWGSPIPRRLARRIDVEAAIVLNSWDGPPEPGLADFLLWPAQQALPEPGRIGAVLDEQDGALRIDSCSEDSACAEVGMQRGDRIIAIDDASINSMADLRLALWDKQPGDTVTVDVLRSRILLPSRELSYEIRLR